jgi:hypothetical protein
MWGREAYARWAPAGCPWSPWVKPTLFAQDPSQFDLATSSITSAELPITPASALTQFASSTVPAEQGAVIPLREDQLEYIPRADGKTLIVAELPGVNSVQLGTMLAMDSRFAVDRWRPVPLFNATHDTKAEVPQVPIIRAMMAATDELAFASIPPNAPPVFLLDAGRKGRRGSPPPGTFDNRSIVFPQDFPSGNLLLSMGIENALVLVNGSTTLSDDLAHVVAPLARGGNPDLSRQHRHAGPAGDFRCPQASGFRNLMYRALASMGLHRNSAGGFGARVPVPSQGGHGYGLGFG